MRESKRKSLVIQETCQNPCTKGKDILVRELSTGFNPLSQGALIERAVRPLEVSSKSFSPRKPRENRGTFLHVHSQKS